jgi:integrase
LPEKGQRFYRDANLKGFGVRVSQGGTKTFVVVHGVNRQYTKIGRYPTISLSKARDRARTLLAQYTLGKTETPTVSFAEARNLFLEASQAKNSPRTVTDYTRLLDRHFKFGRLPLKDVTREEITRRLNYLKGVPSERNHAFVAIRVFLNWALREQYIQQNPMAGMQLPARTSPRERILSDYELGIVYKASLDYPYPYGPIVSLLILTGQRRSEIGMLQWDWIDEDKQLITLPSTVTKNRRTHTFPYMEAVEEVLAGVPRINQYVFPASRSHVRGKPTTSYNGWAKTKPKFDATLHDVQPFTLHDLRRTVSSGLAKLEVRQEVTEKLLNHVSGGVLSPIAQVYNRHTYEDEIRNALNLWEIHVYFLSKAA